MGRIPLYWITYAPSSAVYHPGFPLAYDLCEHSWWYISRSRQSHIVDAPNERKFLGISFVLSSVRLFQGPTR